MHTAYVYVKQKGHPRSNKDGYVYEHILVAEAMIGRFLADEEIVHHKDGDKRNNEPNNLMIFHTNADHSAFHFGNPCKQLEDGTWISEKKRDVSKFNHVCAICGKEFFSRFEKAKYCDQVCCHIAQRKVQRPSREQLIQDIQTLSFTSIGKNIMFLTML